jgi:hypothetical protein
MRLIFPSVVPQRLVGFVFRLTRPDLTLARSMNLRTTSFSWPFINRSNSFQFRVGRRNNFVLIETIPAP